MLKHSHVFREMCLANLLQACNLLFFMHTCGCWQEQSLWKGDGLPTQEPTAPLVAGNWEWVDLALTCSNFIKSARLPRKRKGTISVTSAGSYSGQLLGYHGNPWLENCFNFKKIATNNNKHKWKMVHCYLKIVLVIGFCWVWGLRLQAQIRE